MKKYDVPIWHKVLLTVNEAVAYSNIGRNQLHWMINAPDCPFVLSIGRKKLIKREVFDEFIKEVKSLKTY